MIFKIIGIEIVLGKSLYGDEYTNTMFKHNAKIFDGTFRDVSVLDFSDVHRKVAQNDRRSHFSVFWTR